MTYREAVARILALRGGEIAGMRPGLERIETLLAAIGNPERGLRIVHVAGTNGKGSVSAMVASMLERAGHRVGLYTSPHLSDFRERIRVNGRPIPEADVGCRGRDVDHGSATPLDHAGTHRTTEDHCADQIPIKHRAHILHRNP